jgi:hypothetical protein
MKLYLPLAVFFLLAFPASPQQPLVGSIQGIIKDQRGVPLPYAILTATNIDAVEPESYRHTTGTDRHGIFQFVDLSPGRFSITVQKKGYRDYTVLVVNVHPGEAVKMPDIGMSPLRNSK